jgi:hypothetical protein
MNHNSINLKRFLLTSIFLTSLSAQAHAAGDETTEGFNVSGYYKNLYTTSSSQVTDEGIFADLNRFRLELQNISDPWQFNLTLDNEALVNDFANTADFDILRSKDQKNITPADWDKISVDNDHLFLRHSIYRAYLKYYSPEFQVVLGKQAVDWGRMRFYSPFDLFNTLSPLDIEQDERVGIDAVNLNFSHSESSGFNTIIVPGQEEKSGAGFKAYKTISTYDFAVIAAYFRKTQTYGFSFDGYLGDAGLRGEITHTQLDNERAFPRASVGIDYNFSEKLYALLEHFYNGGNDDNPASNFTSSYRVSQELLSLKKNLTSLWLQYRLTPLLKINGVIIYDWAGQSTAITHELQYDVTKNTRIAVGAQNFFGGDNSEFGDVEHTYYVEFKWFF